MKPLNKAVLMSFVAASISYGCAEQLTQTNKSSSKSDQIKANDIDPKIRAWVGEYSGVIPCEPCFSFCPDCEGMGVKLIVNADQSFELYRTSYSGHNQAQKYKGKFVFTDGTKVRIQLLDIKERSVLMLARSSVEIIDQDSFLSYEAGHDFKLKKII